MTVDISTLVVRVEAQQVLVVAGQLDNLGESAQSARQQTDSLGGAVKRLADVFSTLKIIEAANALVAAQRGFDQLRASLLPATGNLHSAGVALNALQNYSLNTPYALAELTKAFITLQSQGLSPSERALNAYSNTAAAMGRSLDDMVAAVAGAAGGDLTGLEKFGVSASRSGDMVAMSFRGTTTMIKNSAADIENYLIDLGETRFAGSMEKQLGTLDGAVNQLDGRWEALKRTVAGEGFGDAATVAVTMLSDAMVSLIEQIREGGPAVEGMKAVAKIAAAYFAIFVAAPALLTAASAGLATLYGVVGTGVTRLLTATTVTEALNGSLNRTAGAATVAQAALSKIQAAGSLLFLFFAGWELGKYLESQFVEVRIAGEIMAGGLLTGWENVRYGTKMAVEAMSFAYHGSVSAMKGAFADFLSVTAKGLQLIGATDTGNTMAQYAQQLRTAADAQKSFADITAPLTAAHKRTIQRIGAETDALVNKALVEDRVVQSTNRLSDSQRAAQKAGAELAGGKTVLADASTKVAAATKAEQAATDAKTKSLEAHKQVTDSLAASEAARVASSATLATEYAQYGQNADEREMGAIATKAGDEYNKQVANLKFLEATESANLTAQLVKERDARVAVEQATLGQTKALAYAASLKTDNTKAAAEAIDDPQSRAEALLKIDNTMWQKRLALAGAGTEAQRLLKEQYDIWYAAQSQKVQDEAEKKSTQELDKLAEDGRKFTSLMESLFGSVGKAIGGMANALTDYESERKKINKELAAAMNEAGNKPEGIEKAQGDAAQKSAQAQIKSYGAMASAAKGFFNENSKGYKIMEGAEKAFRTVEQAMALESLVTKSGVLSAFTGLFVTSKATETAIDTTATTASVANSGVRASADGVAAFAKTLSSVPFPFNIAAGATVLALLAGMGVAISGGGGGGGDVTAEQRQKVQGTGSVFGDSSAKSESIARSLELAATNSSIELTYTAGMLASLRAIQSSIGGLGNLLIRGTGITSLASGVGSSSSGGFFGGMISSVFGGKTTVQDTGVMIGSASLAQIAAQGVSSSSYVDTKKSGGWFSSSKYRTSTAALGAEVDGQFTKVILGLADSIGSAAGLLGVGGAAFSSQLERFVVNIGKISLKDLKGEEIQAALEAVFSKLGDDMAQFAVGGLQGFQQVGEGYLETLTRIAANYANLDAILASSGTTFGQTGMASIAAREKLLALAGGIDELASKSNSFNENFLTEAERLAPVQKYVTEQLAAMGLQSLDTRDKFKQYVQGIANSGALLNADAPVTQAGQQQYVALLDLADAFAKTHAATVDLTKSEQAIADERSDLQSRLDELTMTQEQLAAKSRAAIDAHNLALYDQVTAAQAAKDAADEAAAALEKLNSTNAGYQQQIDALIARRQGEAAVRALEIAGMDASTIALYDRLAALKQEDADRATAAAAITALNNTNAGYQQQIDAMVRAGMSAAELRKLETAGMHESTLALYDRLAALKEEEASKAAAAAASAALENTNAGYQQQIDAIVRSGMSAAQLREVETAGMHESTLALYDRLAALRAEQEAEKLAAEAREKAAKALLDGVAQAYSDLQASVGHEKDVLATAFKTASDGIQANIDRVTGSVGKLKSLSEALHSAVDAMGSADPGLGGRQAAQAQVEAALAIARAGGPLPELEGLKGALAALAKDPSDQFATYLDYQRDQYQTQKTLLALAALTDREIGTEERALVLLEEQKVQAQAAYEAEVLRLDGLLEQAKQQVDLLNGIARSLLTLPDAVAAMARALGLAQQAAAQQAAAQQAVAQQRPAVSADPLIALYRELLGREPDADGLAFWRNALSSGVGMDRIRADFLGSDEYRQLQAAGPVPAAVAVNQPTLAMPALAFAPAANSGSGEMVAELREQRRENSELRTMLESHLYAIAKSARNTEDLLDGAVNGGAPIATKEMEEA